MLINSSYEEFIQSETLNKIYYTKGIIKKHGESPKKAAEVKFIDLTEPAKRRTLDSGTQNNYDPSLKIVKHQDDSANIDNNNEPKITDSLNRSSTKLQIERLFGMFMALVNIRGFCRNKVDQCDIIGQRVDLFFKKICPCARGRFAFTRYFLIQIFK